jgi:hypothetical protein
MVGLDRGTAGLGLYNPKGLELAVLWERVELVGFDARAV